MLASDFVAPPFALVERDCVDAETVTLLLFEDVEAEFSLDVEVAFSFLAETFYLDESPLFAELDWDELSTFFLIDFFDMTATE